jgi:hypothetical protein
MLLQQQPWQQQLQQHCQLWLLPLHGQLPGMPWSLCWPLPAAAAAIQLSLCPCVLRLPLLH